MKNLFHAALYLTAAHYLTVPEISLAQENRRKASGTVEEVVITASPLGSTDLRLAQPVTVLSGEKLANSMSSSIGETLSHQIGISSTAFGAGASRPVIRGQGASRVRLMESGISSMDVSNLSPDHAISIEPLAATQIEVLKGPSTLLYGSGASGGVVNVVTNRIPTSIQDSPSFRGRAVYDSVSSERTGAFSLDSGSDKFAVHFDGSLRNADDYDIPGFANLPPEPDEVPGTLLNSDLETESLNGGLSYIGEQGYAGFGVGHYETDYGIPGEGVRIKLDQTRYDIKAELKNPFQLIEKVKFQLGHVDYEHKEIEPSGEVGTTFLNDEYEGRLEFLHSPVAGWNGALGMQVGHRDFLAIGEESLTPPLVLNTLGLFMVEEHDVGDWHLEFGGRVEKQNIDPDDDSPKSRHKSYSVSGGTIWEFMPDYSLAFYLSRSQRAPSLEELYNHGPHEATETYEVGSINLRKETANNLDFTFRGKHESWNWQMSLFYNQIDDYIYGNIVDANNDGEADLVDDEGELITGDDGLVLVNYIQKDADFYGAEAEATFNFGQVANGELEGRLSFDYVRAKLGSGENLPRITPPRVGFGLDYHRGNWSGIFDVFHVFEQDNYSALEGETDDYTLLELSLSYLIYTNNSEIEISLRGRNLLDEEVRMHTSFLKNSAPLPGRGLILGLQVEF